MGDDHDCNADGCDHRSELANELVERVLQSVDGKPMKDAIDVLGQVSALLEASVLSKMKMFGVEQLAVDSWRDWRNNAVLEAEEEMIRNNRQNGGADGQS